MDSPTDDNNPLPQSTLVCLQFIDEDTLDDLETLLRSDFKRRALLAQAFIHKSCHYALKNKVVIQSNEKLEHLGDKVVGLAVCAFMHMKYPDRNEHFYTQVMQRALSNEVLSMVGTAMELDRFLVTKLPNQVLSAKTTADLVEAVAGALFLDGGSEAVDRFLSQRLYPLVELIAAEKAGR